MVSKEPYSIEIVGEWPCLVIDGIHQKVPSVKIPLVYLDACLQAGDFTGAGTLNEILEESGIPDVQTQHALILTGILIELGIVRWSRARSNKHDPFVVQKSVREVFTNNVINSCLSEQVAAIPE